MAATTFHTGTGAGAAQRAWTRTIGFFDAMGRAIHAARAFDERQRDIRRLDALSDRQLADIGLTRDRIVHRVYADLFES